MECRVLVAERRIRSGLMWPFIPPPLLIMRMSNAQPLPRTREVIFIMHLFMSPNTILNYRGLTGGLIDSEISLKNANFQFTNLEE